MSDTLISRRNFLRLSATVGLGTFVAACAPADPQGSASSGSQGAAPGSESVTLRVHHRLGNECDNWGFAAEQFMNEHPDVQIEMECFPGADYFKKLNTLAAGGTVGDVLWISSIEGYYRLAATGVLAPLDDLVAQRDLDLSGIYELSVEAAKHNGKLFGLPQNAHPGRAGLFYDKTLFDQAGIDYPNDTWTYDDLLAAAQELTNEAEGVYGFIDPESTYFSILIDLRAWGGDVINEDGTRCPINSPEAVDALKFRSDLYHVHKVAPLPGQAQQGTDQLVAAHKVAMFQRGYWGWRTRDFLEDPEALGVAPMPKGPTGNMGSMFESDPACLTAISEHKEEAFDYISIFTTYDAQLRNFREYGRLGCRPDVLASDEAQQNPMVQVFADIFAQAMPLVLPANFRETEYFKTITEELSVVWLGQNSVEEVIDSIQVKAQEILDKPSLSTAA